MSEKEGFEAAVAAEVERRIAEIHAQWAASMEAAMQSSLQQVDEARMSYKTVEAEANNARDLHRATLQQATEEGRHLAQQYLEEHRAALTETAQVALLLKLARKHLGAGHSTEEVAHWLEMEVAQVQRIASETQQRPPLTTAEAHQRRLSYRDEGRSGTIWYEDGRTKFSVWWEFGGSPDVLAFIDVPSTAQWEARTGLPLAERADTLHFMATQVIRDKCMGDHRFSVGEAAVVIHQ